VIVLMHLTRTADLNNSGRLIKCYLQGHFCLTLLEERIPDRYRNKGSVHWYPKDPCDFNKSSLPRQLFTEYSAMSKNSQRLHKTEKRKNGKTNGAIHLSDSLQVPTNWLYVRHAATRTLLAIIRWAAMCVHMLPHASPQSRNGASRPVLYRNRITHRRACAQCHLLSIAI
jgi:hypothetical protein